MDIGGINSEYLNNILNNAKTSASGAGLQEKLESFQGILDARMNKDGEAKEAKDTVPASSAAEKGVNTEEDKKLMEACKEFEAYFYEQIFKEMKKSVSFTDSGDAASKQLMDYYEDNLTSEYAKLAAGQQENGFAQMLYEQMKRNYTIS